MQLQFCGLARPAGADRLGLGAPKGRLDIGSVSDERTDGRTDGRTDLDLAGFGWFGAKFGMIWWDLTGFGRVWVKFAGD